MGCVALSIMGIADKESLIASPEIVEVLYKLMQLVCILKALRESWGLFLHFFFCLFRKLLQKGYDIIILLFLILAGLVLAGCSTPTFPDAYALASLDKMPEEVQSSPRSVQEAYQFAVENSDALKEVPCYCGCGGMGHTSNYSCYVAGEESSGEFVFDGHALGCSICVDITQDTMRMLEEGKSIPEIKAEINDIYSAFGPSNMP